MTTPDELITILDRILNGGLNVKDITLLRQYLEAINGQNQTQLAKNIVNANEIQGLHIGDRTYYGADAETIKAAIREILPEIITGIEKSLQQNPQISRPSDLLPQIGSEDAIPSSFRFAVPAGLVAKGIAIGNSKTQSTPPTTTFDFEVVIVDTQGRETKRFSKQAEYFVENLGDSFGYETYRVILEMVSLPDGKFQMGAAKDEEASQEERPQRIVNIKSFFLSKYPITQAQWKVVAKLPKINLDIKAEPSNFKGDNLPVERVSWYDAQEFCQRLSRETGRTYRLPSEAEWEYACRAKTSTPFHFGKLIATHLANFHAENENIEGVNRQQTTEVGRFPANSFGLYDMHGLVWEWCADYDHEDYYGAPSDGSAWLDDGNQEYRILRGGSWNSSPNLCRSASRFCENASVTDKEFGFRVVCS